MLNSLINDIRALSGFLSTASYALLLLLLSLRFLVALKSPHSVSLIGSMSWELHVVLAGQYPTLQASIVIFNALS
jgi:hypothetical protein